MVTLGDEGWFAPADGIGDGSYAYSKYSALYIMNKADESERWRRGC